MDCPAIPVGPLYLSEHPALAVWDHEQESSHFHGGYRGMTTDSETVLATRQIVDHLLLTVLQKRDQED